MKFNHSVLGSDGADYGDSYVHYSIPKHNTSWFIGFIKNEWVDF